MTLTKTEYLLFLKHRTWLWLKKNAKQLLPPIDANTQVIFDAGNRLEAYAEQLFPNGTHLGFNSYAEYTTLSARTKKALDKGDTILFQARFDTDKLTCLTDIVEFTGPKTLNLYEIKSSTKVKPEHEYDLSFQMLVLETLGYTVQEAGVIHVNNTYKRSGKIDSKELFTTTLITDQVREKVNATQLHLEQAFAVASLRKMPDPSPRFCRLNSLSDWLPIFRALEEVPERSIYDLMSPSAQLLGELEDENILLLKDVPLTETLSDRQRRQIETLQTDAPSINKPQIKEFLDALVYPLYFFDYETAADVIPPYDGVRPYQQVPTQYSLHILDEPGGELRHTEYIHKTPDHPAHALTKALQKDMGPTGSVIVWYAKFESSRNSELAESFPEYAPFYTDINNRIIDLMIPFSEGMYTDPGFMGSASIKKVLPVLVPELSYKDQNVQEGQTAQRLWMQAVLEDKRSEKEKEQLFKDLLSYCELDTLAMVKIYEKLINV